MVDVRAIRELETWTAGNILGGLVLLSLLIVGIVVLITRYLRQ